MAAKNNLINFTSSDYYTITKIQKSCIISIYTLTNHLSIQYSRVDSFGCPKIGDR